MYLHTRVYKTDLALSTNVSKKLCCLFTDFSSPVLPIQVLVFLIKWLPCNEKSSKSNTNEQKYRSIGRTGWNPYQKFFKSNLLLKGSYFVEKILYKRCLLK